MHAVEPARTGPIPGPTTAGKVGELDGAAQTRHDARCGGRRQAGRGDEPRRRRACSGGGSVSVRSATPARSTPTRPACSSSASAWRRDCCGSSTDSRKRYAGEVVLGTETSTLDAAGEVTARPRHGRGRRRRRQTGRRRAPHRRHPPGAADGVGAQVGGRRLHELAREGIEVERAPRPVTVFTLRRRGRVRRPACCAIDVECSSGTYIRSLAADLGRLLGGGAHLRNLRRTAVGRVHDRRGRAARRVRAVAGRDRRAITGARVTVADDVAALVANGRVLEACVGGATGRGRCSTNAAPCSRCTSRSASARPSRPSCSRHWPPGSVAAVRVITDLTGPCGPASDP